MAVYSIVAKKRDIIVKCGSAQTPPPHLLPEKWSIPPALGL
jgi:hypothetical protein